MPFNLLQNIIRRDRACRRSLGRREYPNCQECFNNGINHPLRQVVLTWMIVPAGLGHKKGEVLRPIPIQDLTRILIGGFDPVDADLHANEFLDRDVWVGGFGIADEFAVDLEDAKFDYLFGCEIRKSFRFQVGQ